MNEKVLRWLINIAGIVCLYAFLAIRFQSMFNFVVQEKLIPEYWENTKYGELYYFNFIKNFREKNLPPHSEKYRFTEKHPSIQDADVLTFGDSFLDFTRLVTYPEQLGNITNMKVYYERYDYPLESLFEKNYISDKPKVLIYESAERYVPTRFMTPHRLKPLKDNRNIIRKGIASFRDFLFLSDTEPKYTMLLNRSYFTTIFYSMISTFKFNTYGYISPLTPKYSINHDIPWLFYHDQLNNEPSSFYYHHSQGEIDTICNNILKVSDILKENYNLHLVFMPIPSKYTINHRLINNDEYNNFLPRIYEGLEKRGVPVIKLYDDYLADDEILYYGTDTHWNQKGIDIAINKTVRVLSNYYTGNLIAKDSSEKKSNTIVN